MTKEFNFDQVLDRRNGDSHKWNKYAKAAPDVIGAWLADMDFLPPPAVVDAVQERLNGPALGYSEPPRELIDVILERLERLYGWRVHPSWLVGLPGVVPGLYGATRAVGGAGDGVITQSPNYHHFFKAAEFSDRKLMRLRNQVVDGCWEMDFDHLQQLAEEGASSFLLCNPHNPVGRVLSREELQQVADICLAHDMLICSDEIHADILLDEDKPHIPIATLSPDVEQQSITLIAPTKTFNLPGIGGFALAIIPNPAIRAAFEKQLYGVATHPSALAFAAALASYRDCADWYSQLLVYLRGNRGLLEQRIAAMPGLEMTHVEATFLAWINVGALGLDKPASHFLLHGVALSDGTELGDPGYLRLNFACTRATLEEMLNRMEKAIAVLSSRELYLGGDTMSETTEARKAAVTSTMEAVRELSPDGEPSREVLDQIEARLGGLIASKDLFSDEHYPSPPAESPGHVYLIAEDEGHRNSLYLVCANGKASVPPHDHKTWAAIAGLAGAEENTLFEKAGDDLTETGKLTLGEGDTISMMPEDIHTIRAVGGPTRHLHWYGKGFSEQTGKVAYVDGVWIDVPADMIPVDESRRVL
jgi:cystathionine beta-lyase